MWETLLFDFNFFLPIILVSVVPNTPHVFPKTITLDFGDGCIGRDGKLRKGKGKIISVYTGPMFISGSKISTTFADYFVNSFKVERTHSVENTSTSNKKEWTVKVADGKITSTNTGNWKVWSGIKIHTQMYWNGTQYFPLDDVFQITGNANGAASGGNSWSASIGDPLIKKFTCHWIVKCTVRIARNDNKAILDYGDGACDNKAIITINGFSKNITLRW